MRDLVKLSEPLALGGRDGDADALLVLLGEGEATTLREPVRLADRDDVSDTLPDELALDERDTLADTVLVELPPALRDGVTLVLGEAVLGPVNVRDKVALGDPLALRARVDDGVALLLALAVGKVLPLREPVLLADRVRDRVTLRDTDTVLE